MVACEREAHGKPSGLGARPEQAVITIGEHDDPSNTDMVREKTYVNTKGGACVSNLSDPGNKSLMSSADVWGIGIGGGSHLMNIPRHVAGA